MSRAGCGQETECCPGSPIGVPRGEVEPDADGALRIDLELSIALEVPELPRRSVVEGHNDRTRARRQVDLAIDKLGNRDRAVTLLIEQLEIPAEAVPGAAPATVLLRDQMVFQNRYAAQGVGRPGFRRAGLGPNGGGKQKYGE